MDKLETIEEFYQRKNDWMPDNLRTEIGHFNVFRIEPFMADPNRPVPYKRRDYFKITFIYGGNSFIQYADRVVEVKNHALVFSNPQIPYSWDHADMDRGGAFCVFNEAFFHQFGDLNQYSVFQPNQTHVFELTDEQVPYVTSVYEKMVAELGSDYVHKYDVLRTLVFELLHFAMKTQPSAASDRQHKNASQRITTLFLELLERQFPIDETHQKVKLRSASEFADQLSVHVNHLNRAVKETTLKTTTQLIAERVLQEAKILLRHSTWNVAEIAYALGFTEVTHFNNFFKKHVQQSPLRFRNV